MISNWIARKKKKERKKNNNLHRFFFLILIFVPIYPIYNRVAYGYVNSWLSVYNDEWCQKLSTQVHGELPYRNP